MADLQEDWAAYEKLQQCLLEHRELLVKTVDVKKFFAPLRSRMVLTYDDQEEISNQLLNTTSAGRAGFLLDTIARKGPNGLQCFLKVLEYEYPETYQRVTGAEARAPPQEYIDSMVTSRNTFFIEEISGVLMRAMQENKENKNNKAEMDKMKRLVDKLQQASDRLEQENSQLQTKLADYNKLKLDVQHLLHEKNNLLQINAETSRMCLTYSQESKRMEDRCRQAMIERDKAVRQCRQYELRIEQCEGQYKQANRLTQVLQDQLDKESKERLDEIKIENDGLRRQLDQMKRQVMHSVAPSVSENYSPMEMELEILREQVRDLEQANETYGQELMTARQAQHDAAKDKLKLCEENDKYLIKVNQLLKEVDQTKQQREEYWGQLQQIRAERDEIARQRDLAQSQCKDRTNDRDRVLQEKYDIEKEKEDLCSQLHRLEAQCSSLKAMMKEARRSGSFSGSDLSVRTSFESSRSDDFADNLSGSSYGTTHSHRNRTLNLKHHKIINTKPGKKAMVTSPPAPEDATFKSDPFKDFPLAPTSCDRTQRFCRNLQRTDSTTVQPSNSIKDKHHWVEPCTLSVIQRSDLETAGATYTSDSTEITSGSTYTEDQCSVVENVFKKEKLFSRLEFEDTGKPVEHDDRTARKAGGDSEGAPLSGQEENQKTPFYKSAGFGTAGLPQLNSIPSFPSSTETMSAEQLQTECEINGGNYTGIFITHVTKQTLQDLKDKQLLAVSWTDSSGCSQHCEMREQTLTHAKQTLQQLQGEVQITVQGNAAGFQVLQELLSRGKNGDAFFIRTNLCFPSLSCHLGDVLHVNNTWLGEGRDWRATVIQPHNGCHVKTLVIPDIKRAVEESEKMQCPPSLHNYPDMRRSKRDQDSQTHQLPPRCFMTPFNAGIRVAKRLTGYPRENKFTCDFHTWNPYSEVQPVKYLKPRPVMLIGPPVLMDHLIKKILSGRQQFIHCKPDLKIDKSVEQGHAKVASHLLNHELVWYSKDNSGYSCITVKAIKTAMENNLHSVHSFPSVCIKRMVGANIHPIIIVFKPLDSLPESWQKLYGNEQSTMKDDLTNHAAEWELIVKEFYYDEYVYVDLEQEKVTTLSDLADLVKVKVTEAQEHLYWIVKEEQTALGY